MSLCVRSRHFHGVFHSFSCVLHVNSKVKYMCLVPYPYDTTIECEKVREPIIDLAEWGLVFWFGLQSFPSNYYLKKVQSSVVGKLTASLKVILWEHLSNWSIKMEKGRQLLFLIFLFFVQKSTYEFSTFKYTLC